MAQQNQSNKTLSQIAESFSKDIDPAELEDILNSVRTLKNGSGWGRIDITYKAEMTDIDILITRKMKNKKTV